MDTPPITIDNLARFEAELADSEADLAAGRIVSLEPVLERMRASIERMEAKRAQQSRAGLQV